MCWRKATIVSTACALGIIYQTSLVRAATISLGYDEASAGVSFTVLTTSNSGSASSGPAGAGTFTGLTVTATGTPNIPSPNLTTTDVSVSGGETSPEALDVWITQSGLTAPLGVLSLLSSLNVTTFTAPSESVQVTTYIDPTNGEYGALNLGSLVTLATLTCTSAGCTQSSTNNTPNLSGSYAETIEYTINMGGTQTNQQGSVGASADISATPLPAALPLFAGGLGLVGLLAGRRKRRLQLWLREFVGLNLVRLN